MISQLSFAQKIIRKSFKLANVIQLAQMYTFAPNRGEKSSSFKIRFWNASQNHLLGIERNPMAKNKNSKFIANMSMF